MYTIYQITVKCVNYFDNWNVLVFHWCFKKKKSNLFTNSQKLILFDMHDGKEFVFSFKF